MAAKSKVGFRYVPEDIVHSILPKLPDCSVLRFRCVSKQWRRLISGMKIKMVLASNIPFIKINQTAGLEFIGDQSFIRRVGWIPLLGSWDGLLLVMVDDDLYLWNPSNRKPQCHQRVVSVHECINLIDPGMESFKFFDVVASGLCFDSVKGELKAVMALRSTYSNAKMVVMIGLETKVTEMIDFPYEFVKLDSGPRRYYSLISGPVVNNRLHWCIHSPSPSQQHILYFDPNVDVKFVELPLPEGNYRIMGLGVLDGCLCMARRNQKCTGDVEHLDVIAMKEYGLEESWEVLFRISRYYDYYKDLVPLFYTRNKDEVLMKGMGAISTYNTRNQSQKDIYTCGLVNDTVIVYEESLDHD